MSEMNPSTQAAVLPFPSNLRRCAAYTRYSDAELQRGSSIDQQFRACVEAALKDGGCIPEENHFPDPGVLGSEWDRPGLNRLKAVIRNGEADFTDVYIFETARLTRDSEMAASLRKFFNFYGIRVHFVANGMVSGSAGFDMQHSLFSALDQQFSTTLGHNVKRGHLDQLQNGYLPYGRCYGYRNVDDIDPAQADSYNRSKSRKGVLQVIEPMEAEVVRLIFDLYLSKSMGYHAIARHLNERGIKSPRRPTKNTQRGWSISSVRGILSNQRYIGTVTHSKIETLRNPETRKVVNRKRPKSEWKTFQNPSLRIISDEDFFEVQKRREALSSKDDQRKKGGLARTEKSRSHLFSGLLKCGKCGGAISITQDETYMCTTAYRKLNCSNKLKLRRRCLERHLIETLAATTRHTFTFETIKAGLVKEVRKQEAEKRREADGFHFRRESAASELLSLTNELDGIASLLVRHGFSDTLSKKLREGEARKAVLTETLEKQPKPVASMSEKEVEEFLSQALDQLAEILLSEPLVCKQEIRKRVERLVLEPTIFENHPAYRIRGDLRLFAGAEGEMLGCNSSIKAKHLDHLFIGLDGAIIKMDQRGEILRIARSIPWEDAGLLAA